MAISVRKTSLWKREVDNNPGTLAQSLQPLADAGNDLDLVMGYGTGNKKAVIEVAPISGKRATANAERAGFGESRVPAVVVTGDNRAGLGHEFARAIPD